MAVLLITHDLGRRGRDRRPRGRDVCGPQGGGGRGREIFDDPLHPYTRGLLKAARWESQRRRGCSEIPGTVPSPLDLPPGCASRRAAPTSCRAAAGSSRRCIERRRRSVRLASSRRRAGDERAASSERRRPGEALSGARPALSASARVVHALDGVSLSPRRGETLAVVGESGCGKSTLARCLLRLVEPTSGTIRLDGHDVTQPSAPSGAHPRAASRSSSRIRMRASTRAGRSAQTLGTALRLHGDRHARGAARAGRRRCSNRSASSASSWPRYPHELSGGQRQRVAIARALAVRPRGHRVRRAGVGARRLGPGAGHQPAEAPAARVRPDLRVHLARSRARAAASPTAVAVMYLGQIVELAPTRELSRRASSIPIRRRCSPATPIADPGRAAAGAAACCSAATCRARSTPPAAAASTRAVLTGGRSA